MDLAIVQLASWGDTILSTCLPRAIKEQRPDWHITYYTSSACASAVHNNPDIDKLEVIPATRAEAFEIWNDVVSDAKRRHSKVVQTWAGKRPREEWQLINKKTKRNFMWSAPRCIQELGLKFSQPLVNYIYFTPDEELRARNKLKSIPYGPRILLEVEAFSKQTQFTLNWLKPMFSTICKQLGGATQFLVSIGRKIEHLERLSQRFNITTLDDLSIREVALLIDDCVGFLGVSSGTSNACHHQHRKRQVVWCEAVNHTDWCSAPYGGDKNIHLGGLDGYLKLLAKVF